MEDMFRDAPSFDGDISAWNTSNVELMDSMFEGATSFNENISGWDVGRVTSMFFMFYRASYFNQCLQWSLGVETITHHMFTDSGGSISKNCDEASMVISTLEFKAILISVVLVFACGSLLLFAGWKRYRKFRIAHPLKFESQEVS